MSLAGPSAPSALYLAQSFDPATQELVPDDWGDDHSLRYRSQESRSVASRESIGTADFSDIAHQLLSGELKVNAGCKIEVSSAVWHSASHQERAAFLDACAAKRIEYEFVRQIGGVSIVCD